MASTRTVSCNGCGAPLEVSEAARFVTCAYCDARLRIEHTDSAVWTEAVEKLARDQERIARETAEVSRELRRAKLERELAEREWEHTRASVMLRREDGTLIEPGRTLPWMLSATVVAALGALYILRNESLEFGLVVVLLLGALGGAIYLRVSSMKRAYDRALELHVERTAEVEAKLRKLGRSQ